MLELWYRVDDAGRPDILAYARKLLAEQEHAAGASLLLAREAARALVLQATGLLNQALDVYDEASKSCTDDDITARDHVVRARAALVRAMATPAQRAAEFKTALAMLARPPGANEGMINDALRQHVVELAWADDLRQHELGLFLLADGVIMDDIGCNLDDEIAAPHEVVPTTSRAARLGPAMAHPRLRRGL